MAQSYLLFFEPSDKTIILLNEETQAKQVPMNYSHQIAEKFVMSENKTTYRGRGGQISTPILRGHRAGVSCVKKPKSNVSYIKIGNNYNFFSFSTYIIL